MALTPPVAAPRSAASQSEAQHRQRVATRVRPQRTATHVGARHAGDPEALTYRRTTSRIVTKGSGGVCGMDAASKPPWTDSRRPPEAFVASRDPARNAQLPLALEAQDAVEGVVA